MMKPERAKEYIRKMIHKQFGEELFTNIGNKSKIAYLTKGYLHKEKAKYTNKLNRKATSMILKAKIRMPDIKTNYRNKYKKNLECKLYHKEEETPEHIFLECEETEKTNLRIDTDLLFSRSTTILKTQTKKLEKLMDMLTTRSENNSIMMTQNQNYNQKNIHNRDRKTCPKTA